MTRKYLLPDFLSGIVAQDAYVHWLRNKAKAHLDRDRGRGNTSATGESYREAIHRAVIESNGFDAYTGETLDWSLISKYDNEESKKNGRQYKKEFALLPTVDHVGDGKGKADFKVCGWRTNDAKHDLDLSEFMAVCEAVLSHHGYVIKKGNCGNDAEK